MGSAVIAYNTPIESAVRVLAILVERFPDAADLTSIVRIDYASVHSGDFNGPRSLHPPVPLRATEVSIRRRFVEDGLQVLLRSGLAEFLPRESGFEYRATESSQGFLGLLQSPYARQLTEAVAWVVANLDEASIASSLVLGMTSPAEWESEAGWGEVGDDGSEGQL